MSRRELREADEVKSKKKIKIIVIVTILILLAMSGAGVFAWYYYFKTPESIEPEEFATEVTTEPVKKVEIFQGNDRPIAVMIDNHKAALPQGGLNEAFIVYEIIVEGGESRLMALFKGAAPEKIGPVRSSRHYYLDYALENDAIYVHYGWSPQAQSDISSLGVNNINGINESTKDFWRASGKSSPHDVATTIEKIKTIAERKGYRTTSEQESLLHYVAEEFELQDGIDANKVYIPYSDSNSVRYTYNPETKRYQRYSKGVELTDWSNGEPVTTKNIIIEFVQNSRLKDNENKDRQTLSNITTANGYYITNGKAIKITCEKTSRNSKTVYRDLNGNEIDINDGNTYIQICPIDANVQISAE